MTKSLSSITWALMILTILSLSNGNVREAAALAPEAAEGPGTGTTSSECMPLIYNMSDCLTYVEKGSNETKPEKACCPELAAMLDSKPICLCQLLGKTKDFPVELDVHRALQLPRLCALQTPPLSICSVAGIRIGGPAVAPTSSQGATEAEAREPSPEKNEASNTHMYLLHLLGVIAIVLISLTL